jgi:phosphoribosylformylglycinamidine cyclo-ligase
MAVSDEAYRQAGVDLKSADAVVGIAKNAANATVQPWLLGGIGGFSGAFEIPAGYEQPVLLCACDGVGTKLKLAFEAQRHDTVGIDLVAMSVNDILVSGGRPLVFLDYLATQKILPEQLAPILEGVAEGCRQAECALIGGETAEMPGFYTPGEYDLAGFCVGIAEKARLYPRKEAIQDGDTLIGLSSSGLHSNGFSLVRKILWADNDVSPRSIQPKLNKDGDNKTLIEHLLTPTRIYVKPILTLLEQFPQAIKAMAHITGGGFYDNIPRILNDKLMAEIDATSWPMPPIFDYLQELGRLDLETLWHTFNCGIGYVLVVSSVEADAILDHFEAAYESGLCEAQAYKIGKLRTRTSGGSQQVLIR